MLENLRAQWEQLPTWQRALVVVIFSAVVLYGIYNFLIVEEKKRIETLKKDISNLRAEIDRYKQTINPAFLESLRKELKRLKEEEKVQRIEFEKAVGKVPTKDDVNVIIKDLGNLAIGKGLSVLSLSVSAPQLKLFTVRNGTLAVLENQKGQKQQGVPLYVIGVSLNVEGDSEAIIGFFESLSGRGIVSYPSKVDLKPIPDKNRLSGSVIINIVAKARD